MADGVALAVAVDVGGPPGVDVAVGVRVGVDVDVGGPPGVDVAVGVRVGVDVAPVVGVGKTTDDWNARSRASPEPT